MKNLQNFLVEDSNIFGPGTDLVVSLAAVLIILIAVNANSFHQKLAEQEEVILDCHEIWIEYKNCKQQLEYCRRKYRQCKTAKQELETKLEDCYRKHRQCKAAKQELETKLENCYRRHRQCEAAKQKLETKFGQIDIQEVKKNQMEIVNKIAAKYNRKPLEMAKNIYGILIRRRRTPDIVIQNDVTIQRISFGSHILFDVDKTELKKNGKKVLTIVGNIFKKKLGAIQEIQIQGHADIQKSKIFPSNLELAAHRAIEVFKHFQELGIDPTRHIMSATSFGEYKPVQRRYSDMYYNDRKLKRDNNTSKKREKNRRIEVVLIYRRKH